MIGPEVVNGIREPNDMTPSKSGSASEKSGKGFEYASEYLSALGVVLLSTFAAFAIQSLDRCLSHPVHSANIAMPFLLGVVICAINFHRWPALWGVILSVVSFDFFFVPPIFGLIPDDPDYLLVIFVFFVVALIVNELSFRSRLHERLLGEAQSAIQSEKIKNTILRSVSHDLRSPLAAIMGAASSLTEAANAGVSQEECAELAQSIFKEGKRLERQVTNLLEMTSLESGGIVLQKDWQSSEEVVGSALSALETSLGDKQIDIDIDPKLPLVFVDGVLIEKIFINLIENSLKYAPDSDYGIRIWKGDGTLEAEVSNNGPPIPEGEEKRIFQKFYRSSKETDGAGLGLAICQTILILHDGKIWAESGLTQGVKMRFSIPMSGVQPQMDAEDETVLLTE